MRRKNVAKRFGIASLCLATAISAFSGIALLDNDVALAIGGKNEEPFSCITAENPYAMLSYDGGVRLSSDTPYEETLNGVFTGDTALTFTFPENFDKENKWYGGEFTVRVTDVNDENNYFDVLYYSYTKTQTDATEFPTGYSHTFTRMAVKYKGMVRALNKDKKGIETSCSNNTMIGAPTFLTHYQNGQKQAIEGTSKIAGKLTFIWSADGVLSILTNSCASGNGVTQYTIAAFDGTYDNTANNDGVVWSGKTETSSFGLPKIAFEDGYKISLLSDFTVNGADDHATDVCIQEIKTDGTTADGETTYKRSANYADYKNEAKITVFNRGNAYKTVEVGDELIIPVAIYDDNQEVIDVQVVRPNGTKASVTPGKPYKVKAKGVHHVTYTVYHKSDESVAAFSFTAKDWTTVETTDFVHTAANVEQNNNGLQLSSDEAYQGTFKTVFTGNTTLKFKFPEAYTDAYYGDFTFRITDATDDNKYFDIKYYVSNETNKYTGVYVKYGDEVRQSHQDGTAWYNAIQENTATVAYAPSFLSYCGESGQYDGNRMGILSLEWTEDVLAVQANTGVNNDATLMRTIAKFDGANSFVDQESWGLPTMNFANGYTITVFSSSDKATDVVFSAIENGNVTYDFSETELIKDSNMQTFDNTFQTLSTVQTMTGKVFLGWKNTTTNKLYPAYSVVRKVAGQSYETVVMIFDTVDGASVRIDREGGQSGLRFQTVFNVDEYESLKGYIQSFGTLVAYADTLTTVGKDFTIENYQGESTFAQVQNTKGTYEYTDRTGETYTSYSMAVIDIVDYTKVYSARGYLVVVYADGSTKTIYADYDATDNSSSLAEAAIYLKMLDTNKYNKLSSAQKAIVDAYVAAQG